MRGELGVLFQNGEQIGGFKNWVMEANLLPVQDISRWASYQPTWKAWGKKPFFFRIPRENIFNATFYSVIQGQLIEIYNERVKAILPNKFPLNEYLAFSLRMKKA